MKNTKKVLSKGFSLVEMLVVIAVIGIIAAIAVPSIGKINESAKEAKNRRNAQSIASVYASAAAAGLNLADTTTALTIAKVVTGAAVTEAGPFLNTYFGVPNVSAADQTAAATYLNLDTTRTPPLLVYTGTASN
jgi:prepilin-type N-terminal cleavage/methylation domain-containing protein